MSQSYRPWLLLVLCLLAGLIIIFLLQNRWEPFEDVTPDISTLINNDTLASLIKMVQQNPEKVHQMVNELTTTISTMNPQSLSSMDVEPLMKLFQNLTPPS